MIRPYLYKDLSFHTFNRHSLSDSGQLTFQQCVLSKHLDTFDMSAATTRGTILKAEFTWIIRDTFKWPEKNGENLTSPLFHAVNDQEVKWTLKIQKDPWHSEELALFLCLSESPASEPTVTARFSSIVSDDQEGKLLCERKSGSIPLSYCKTSGVSRRNQRMLMGDRYQYLRIPSVSIRVIIEYEKGQLVQTTTAISREATPEVSGVYYPNCWRADFENLFTSQTGSDICFNVQGQEIKAHKTILSARSPVFSAMFNSNMKEKGLERVDLPEISPDIFNALLRFIYTDRVQLTEANVEAILAVANQYLLPSLKSKCEEFIIKQLTTDNCIEMLTLADLHNAQNLKKMTQELFRSRHTEIRKTETWTALKISHPDIACNVMEQLLDLIR